MSSLDFLSPDRARADLGFQPVLKSSLERRQREAGAVFEEREGWLVPVGFPDEADRLASVGLVDLSHLGKLEVRGPGARPEGDLLAWHRIHPDRALLICDYPRVSSLRAELAGRFGLVLDQTGAYGILALVGRRAPELLRRLTHLHSFPASGPVAHTPCHVLERAGSYWILFLQEFGHYLYEVALEEAEELGGGPVGLDAVRGGLA